VPNVVVDANTVASAALKAQSTSETALLFALDRMQPDDQRVHHDLRRLGLKAAG
jgi:hypothetical protein